MAALPTTKITDMPPEIIECFAPDLKPATVSNLRLVCRYFRDVFCADRFYRSYIRYVRAEDFGGRGRGSGAAGGRAEVSVLEVAGGREEVSGLKGATGREETCGQEETGDREEVSGSEEACGREEVSVREDVSDREEVSGREEMKNCREEAGDREEVSGSEEACGREEVSGREDTCGREEVKNGREEAGDREGVSGREEGIGNEEAGYRLGRWRSILKEEKRLLRAWRSGKIARVDTVQIPPEDTEDLPNAWGHDIGDFGKLDLPWTGVTGELGAHYMMCPLPHKNKIVIADVTGKPVLAVVDVGPHRRVPYDDLDYLHRQRFATLTPDQVLIDDGEESVLVFDIVRDGNSLSLNKIIRSRS